ncbi:MAG: class fructose-bisphosphate aldolase [Clostridiaceae bacterium]|nr:class fructose-bisphosphate aldolase [Clostridiaceae bacterium]
MLVNTKSMLLDAKRDKYGVAQPNAWDLNSLRAIIRACEEKKSPAIIGIAEAHFKYMNIVEATNLLRIYANNISIPLALHLDHGSSYEAVISAIRNGFTSVMIDASSEKFEENVRRVSEVVKIAHACGVTVEAELGHVGMGTDYEKIDGELKDKFTSPQQAKKFVELTEVDSLAVAIGTAHGEYKGTPKLDFERLTEISNSVEIPLVLHGGSGTGDEALSKTIKLGISKVNICTDLMKAATSKVRPIIDKLNYADALLVGEESIRECLEHYFDVFGSTNQANNK